tara:strand:+ start:32 stop:217 length:186 start_codon:yes stop_codon:yes gene_type:complete
MGFVSGGMNMTYELTIEENDIDDNSVKDVYTFNSNKEIIDFLLSLLNSYTFMNPTLKRNWK